MCQLKQPVVGKVDLLLSAIERLVDSVDRLEQRLVVPTGSVEGASAKA